MKSWKTSLAGIGAILGALAALIQGIVSGDLSSEKIALIFGGFTTGAGLLAARDNDVTSKIAGAEK